MKFLAMPYCHDIAGSFQLGESVFHDVFNNKSPPQVTNGMCPLALQAQRVHRKFPKPGRAHRSSAQKLHAMPSPSASTPSHTPSSSQQPLLDSPHLEPSQMGLPAGHQQEFTRRASSTPSLPWSFQRSKSLFCLPTEDPSLASSSAVPEWFSNTGVPEHWASEWRHTHPLSIDDLEGAQETDVDTGLRLSSSDLSVVSAYSAPSSFADPLPQTHSTSYRSNP